MKTVIKTFVAVLAMVTLLFQGVVVAQVFQGRIFKVDNLRRTFQITPDNGGGVTTRDIFIVSSSTKIDGAANLWELDVGDRVEVDAKPYNQVVWGAEALRVK